ncbi:MAG: host-nuclease inhibitor Gam family protein [Candidatus Saccharimonas sp.]
MSTEPVIGERIPPSLDEVSRELSLLGNAKGSVASLEAALNKDIRALQDDYAARIDPLTEEITERVAILVDFANNDLTPYLEPGKKSLVLRGGTIGHALSPASAEIADEKKALAWLRKKRWIETFTTRIYTRKIAKSKLLKNPDMALKIPGVTIGQTDDIVLKPHQLPVSIVIVGKRVRIKGKRQAT